MKKTALMGLGMLLSACLTVQTFFAEEAAPLYVDSKAIKDRFDSITAGDMDMLRSKKIIFASRSFGANTCKGLRALEKKDKKYEFLSSYKMFDVFKAGGNVGVIPPDIYSKVNFVHFAATHWPLTKRVDEMEQLLKQPPHNFGKTVDAVIIYYHTSLPEIFDRYSNKMDALQAEFPKIRFIYVTSGFMGPSKIKENENSFAFGEKVRAKYKGKVPLFDMGKILSDDFRCGHMYCPEYSGDPADVHPNLPAGETMLAKGFLLILRDAFMAQPGKGTGTTPVETFKTEAIVNTEVISAGHPDAKAVRALLDANGLTKKTVEGVSVVEKGRITGLYLQECGITELTGDIGKLEALRMLHLYGDRNLSYPLLKKISPEIGRCVNLEELLLNQNDLETLPPEITKIQKLKALSIGENRLKNLSPKLLEWVTRFDPKGLKLQN